MKNKYIKVIFYCLLFLICIVAINVNAAEFDSKAGFDVCAKAGIVKTFQILGYVLFVLKIVVPIILMGLGAMDFGKAVLSSDEKAIKNAITIIVKRAIASVVIFFIPALISATMHLIDGANELNEFGCLSECISKPNDSLKCTIPDNIIFGDGE
jgi:hypothetical protein